MNKKTLTAWLIAASVFLGAVSGGAATVEFGLNFEYTGNLEKPIITKHITLYKPGEDRTPLDFDTAPDSLNSE